MSTENVANQIQSILRSQGAASAEVCILTNLAISRPFPGFFIGIGANNAVEIDLVQAIMTMTGATFQDWLKDETGDMMIYFIPANPSS